MLIWCKINLISDWKICHFEENLQHVFFFFRHWAKMLKFEGNLQLGIGTYAIFSSHWFFRGQLAVSFKEGSMNTSWERSHMPFKRLLGRWFSFLQRWDIESNTPLRRTAGNTTTKKLFFAVGTHELEIRIRMICDHRFMIIFQRFPKCFSAFLFIELK